jgi:hypothetical protein
MNRRQFLASSVAVASAASLGHLVEAAPATAPATTPASQPIPDNLIWHDVRDWGVEGRGFDDTERYFDRFPARARKIVRPDVWKLSRHTAGMSVRFETDATEIYIRYETAGESLAMPHMPATGVSGLDLYFRDGQAWRYVDTYQPRSAAATSRLAWDLEPGRRRCLIHLPLYNGVNLLEIGIPPGAVFEPIAPRKLKPIVFYGTSITQGGCASRPGMAFTNILGRRLDRPILNFGFSGNGRMEVEVVGFLAEIKPAIFVFDCVANTPTASLAERIAPCVKIVRESHPSVPILLVGARVWPNAFVLPKLRAEYATKETILKSAYDKLRETDPNIHHRSGQDLIGADGEATVDGSHPTDLGMLRYADALEGDLRRLL